MHHWNVRVNEREHEIDFEGRRVSGQVKLRIDGEFKECKTVFVEEAGTLCPFEIDGSEFILKLLDDTPMDLVQDGIYLETGQPVEKELVEGYRAALQAPYKALPVKNKATMASFLSFVILTYVNLALIIIEAPINFPFSAVVPQLLAGLAWYPSDIVLPIPPGVLLLIAFLITSVYLVLYLLGRKRDWPIITALILISIDTLVLLFFAIADFTGFLLDIAFHAWVLISIIRLYTIRLKLKKAT